MPQLRSATKKAKQKAKNSRQCLKPKASKGKDKKKADEDHHLAPLLPKPMPPDPVFTLGPRSIRGFLPCVPPSGLPALSAVHRVSSLHAADPSGGSQQDQITTDSRGLVVPPNLYPDPHHEEQVSAPRPQLAASNNDRTLPAPVLHRAAKRSCLPECSDRSHLSLDIQGLSIQENLLLGKLLIHAQHGPEDRIVPEDHVEAACPAGA
ncbi:hypothetical protein P154DRAFT_581769 [Amniculicola lignicola CBS 123094]|uniref:Uncharacterized protein n=1 Tax=Amniculicola lignicola CBS 123094 TaxID=1392246 RepID=A0A6A5W5S8_9PLEO|nr:hypothetical protein P154DRAFT_581769 [Amniculicola lignicola CBS 123094]